MMPVRVALENGFQIQCRVPLWTLCSVLLLLQLCFTNASFNCSCSHYNDTDIDDFTLMLLNIAGDSMEYEFLMKINNSYNIDETLKVNCSCQGGSDQYYSSGDIATAVLVPLFLEVLIFGIVAAILLWKWRKQISWSKLFTPLSTLKIYVEHTLHNPTYGAEDYPTPSAEEDGPTDLYEEVSGDPVEKIDIPIPSCYAYAGHELPPEPDINKQKEKPPVAAKTAKVSDLKSSQPPGKAKNEGVMAYAVSGIAIHKESFDMARSFSTDHNLEHRSTSEHATRHFSDSRAPRVKKKKPKPMPKSSKVRELVGTKAGVNNRQTLSASTPEGEKYSKLNPTTQYMGLEPHTGSRSNGKNTSRAAPKEEYSHLKH